MPSICITPAFCGKARTRSITLRRLPPDIETLHLICMSSFGDSGIVSYETSQEPRHDTAGYLPPFRWRDRTLWHPVGRLEPRLATSRSCCRDLLITGEVE